MHNLLIMLFHISLILRYTQYEEEVMEPQTYEAHALVSQKITETINEFIRSLDVARTSRTTYKTALRQFFVWLETSGHEKPDRHTILVYKDYLDAKGLRSFTKSSYLVAIRRFFAWAESMKLYPNIAKGIKGTRRSVQVHQKNALTVKQLQKLLHGIDCRMIDGKRDFALINLLTRTGLRLIEVQRANIVDLEITDDEAVLWVRGKGRDDKDAFVVITEEVLEPIRSYLRARKSISTSMPLFASLSDRNHGKRLTTHSLSRMIKQRLHFAGIKTRRITAHSLRHTFGVLAIQAGASLYEVQLAMRHTTPTTTQVYLGDIEQAKRQEGGPERKISKLLK
jgi:integrase/recombinase XerC/integrase/recombinase XerD